MEYGSIFGHGAYLGPGLHRRLPAPRLGARSAISSAARGSDSARQRDDRPVPDQPLRLRHRRRSPFTRPAGDAPSSELGAHYRDFFDSPTTQLRAAARGRSTIRSRSTQLTAFFAWSAWAASARRPGHNYSYTNNWPPEELVGNTPTADVIVWSVISLIALLGGIGVLFAAFGRWNVLGWHGPRAGDAQLPLARRRRAHPRPAGHAPGSSS